MKQNINRTNHLQPVSQPLAAVLTVAKQGQQIIQTKGLVARIEQGATKKREPYILLTLQDKNTKQKVFMWDSTYTEIKVNDVVEMMMKPFGKDGFTFINSTKLNENPLNYLEKSSIDPGEKKEIFIQMFNELSKMDTRYSTLINAIVTPYSSTYFELSTPTYSKVGGFSEFQCKALRLYKALQLQDSLVLLSVFLLGVGELANSYVGLPVHEVEDFEVNERERVAFNTTRMVFQYATNDMEQAELQHLQHIILASEGVVEAETDQAKIVKQIRNLVIVSESI